MCNNSYTKGERVQEQSSRLKRAKAVRRTAQLLEGLEQDLARHGGAVLEMADPDLESAFTDLRGIVADRRRWVAEQQEGE